MNTNIMSSHASRPIARVSAFRLLAVAAAAVAASCAAFAQTTSGTTYWLSGSTGAKGSVDDPWANLQLHKNDTVIFDANKTDNPLFTAFTPWVAITKDHNITSALTAGSSYMGVTTGDKGLYNIYNPYERLLDLLDKTPSLSDMMPSFFTQSDPVYVSTAISQSNDESPDYIKAVTSNPFGVWPISMYSSDALTDTGVARLDMQNAAWVVLTASGTTPAQRTQLMVYYGEYVPVTGQGRPWDGAYSKITLEHIIFYGGYSGGSGGGINFERSSGLPSGSNTRGILEVDGDFAIVGSMALQLGGATNAQDTIQFNGNVYIVGNVVGGAYSVAEEISQLQTSGGGSYHGEGGAMRVASGNQIINFKKDGVFIGNLAAGSGGAISYHNNSTLQFDGKAVFMGNQAGLLNKNTEFGRVGGNGGAIAFSAAGNRGFFNGESFFIANEATGLGGAIATGYADSDNYGSMQFSGRALFSDNISGWNPEVSMVYSNTNVQKDELGQFQKPVGIATAGIDENGVWSGETIINVFSGSLQGAAGTVYGAKIGAGGAIWSDGMYMKFGRDVAGSGVTFLRNSTNGMGGAVAIGRNSTSTQLSDRVDGMGMVFYDDASFIGNVAAINGGAIALGTYGPKRSISWVYDTGTNQSASVYFGKSGSGSTLTMQGNIAYTEETHVTTSDNAFTVQLSTGTTVFAVGSGTVTAVPVFGGGAAFVVGGFYSEAFYDISYNQTGGSGGAFLIGSGSASSTVTSNMGMNYALVLNPLEWMAAGTYLEGGDYGLLKNNVAVGAGGAIATHDGARVYIGSGAEFIENSAGGQGGAIALAMTSGQTYGALGTALLDLRARVADITFSGNRAGVAIDTSTVDLDKILDPDNTSATGLSSEGYMTVTAGSGVKNDIHIGTGAVAEVSGTSPYVALIRMDAYEGRTIYFDGGITMDHSGTKNAFIQINTTPDTAMSSISGTTTQTVVLSNTNAVGTIVFDNASADFRGDTEILHGTLRIQGTGTSIHWGSGTEAGTIFYLGGAATLEANATVNAETIVLGDGATLRVLGDGAAGGSLTLNAASVMPASSTATLNLAGNGRLNLGVTTFAAGRIDSLSVGDIGHTTAQTLTIAQNATTLANIALNNTTLTLGLFGGDESDKFVANDITIIGDTRISLSSIASGNFVIASADGALTYTPGSMTLDYKGTVLTSGGRMTFGANASGGDLMLNLALSNITLDWSGGNSAGLLTLTSGNMTNGDTNYVLGDTINFGSGAASTAVTVGENVLFSDMNVTAGYTFTGDYGITTQAVSASGNGRLTLNASGQTLVLANALGEGQANEFLGGIVINAGTLSVGTAAQLGAALSQISFNNTIAGAASLLITGETILNAAQSHAAQRLDLGAGNNATIATAAAGALYVINNSTSGNGGVFNLAANSTLNLDADGDMFFLNNSATQGGAVAMAAAAVLNIDVGADATVMFGLQGDRTLGSAANISALDSIHGESTSVINKTGDGILSINSNSSSFDGTFNITAGKVALGEGTVFGSSLSSVNVGAGAWLGGAATIGGDLVVTNGNLSIDAAKVFGRDEINIAQVLTVNGSLLLDTASILFNVALSKSNEYSVDNIVAGGPISITGVTSMNFDDLWNGRMILATSKNDAISWTQTASDITLGLATTLEKVVTTTSTDENGNTIYGTSTYFYDVQDYYTSVGTDLTGSEVFKNEDVVVSKGGVALDAKRYQTDVGYELLATVLVVSDTITGEESTLTYFGDFLSDLPSTLGENLVIVSQTSFYDATKLVMDSEVKNMKIYWAGSTGTTWNNTEANWEIPDVEDKTFAEGDSIVFGAVDPKTGLNYDQGNEANRTIEIASRGVRTADVLFTGSDNWAFTGGKLVTNAGANNYKDEEGNDLSTGQLVLDASFTGTVTLANAGVNFNGIYVETETGMVKSPDIDIQNGTLVATAGIIAGNLFNNSSLLIFNQTQTENFSDTRIYGTGDIIQTSTGSGNYRITMTETGIVQASNYYLQQGSLVVKNIGSLIVSDTLLVSPGATLVLDDGVIAGTLVNNGVLRKGSIDSSNGQKPPTDTIQIRDPSVGVSVMPIVGNYYSEGGTIELSTYRDAVKIDNLFITGNASGTSKIVVRNITSMDTAATVGGTLWGTGSYCQPAGTVASVNPNARATRDTPIVTAVGAGGAYNLKLIMDWDNSILPAAGLSSTVPFLTWSASTYVVTTTSTVTTVTVGDVVTSSSVTASTTTTLNVDSNTQHYFTADGQVATIANTGSSMIGSGSIVTSGSITESGTTTAVQIIVVSNTNVVRSSTITYGASEIDYSESRDNYKLVQGRDGNWYFRNDSITPSSTDLPFIGAAPVVADMLGMTNIRAIYLRNNARHDALAEGWKTWVNYTHSDDRLRKDYYDDTMIKQDVFHVGLDYSIVKDDKPFSTTPSFSIGGALAFSQAEAKRNDSTDFVVDSETVYTRADKSTVKVRTNSLSAYGSLRWWRLYLDMILDYSPDATYRASIDNTIPFDMDGNVNGSRTGISAEVGIILNPRGLGQLEIYGQTTRLKHSFGGVSSIAEDTSLTNADGYNPIYDPNSSNGRRYSFSDSDSFRAEAGFRWGSHLVVTDRWAIRPWGGLSYGRVASSDYQIKVDKHFINNDMRGNFFGFQGGAAALFKRNWQFYLTLAWTNGDPANNYTLSSGVNYLW